MSSSSEEGGRNAIESVATSNLVDGGQKTPDKSSVISANQAKGILETQRSGQMTPQLPTSDGRDMEAKSENDKV